MSQFHSSLRGYKSSCMGTERYWGTGNITTSGIVVRYIVTGIMCFCRVREYSVIDVPCVCVCACVRGYSPYLKFTLTL